MYGWVMVWRLHQQDEQQQQPDGDEAGGNDDDAELGDALDEAFGLEPTQV
jgi:hypothetical protein